MPATSFAGLALVALVGFVVPLVLDLDRLRGRVLRVTGLAFLLSFGIALVVGYGLGALGLIHAPLLVAIILVATSLGIVIPLLKDAGEISSDFGQLTIAGASIADFGAIILLSLFFSRQGSGIGAQLVLLGGFALLAVVVAIALTRTERSMRLSTVLLRLQG